MKIKDVEPPLFVRLAGDATDWITPPAPAEIRGDATSSFPGTCDEDWMTKDSFEVNTRCRMLIPPG